MSGGSVAGEKPFYQRWWFLVIIALIGIILVLVVVGILYVTGKKRRHSRKSPSSLQLLFYINLLCYSGTM